MAAAKLKVEKLTVHTDPRGCVFEPLDAELFPGQKNVHVVVTHPGGIRGNHFHKQGTEVMTVTGHAFVRIRDKSRIRDVEIMPGEAFRFTFPPGTSHAIQNIGREDSLLVAFNTQPHDPANPDSETDILIQREKAPF